MSREKITEALVKETKKKRLALCPSGGAPTQPVKTSDIWGQDAGTLYNLEDCKPCAFVEKCVAEVFNK